PPPYSAETPDLRPNLSMRVAYDNRDAAHLAADYLERPGHPQPDTALDEPKRPAWGAPRSSTPPRRPCRG
ncbi:MAG TPA: hypothetical protein VHN38_02270, partial [Immundisolibacter sp.]|nr:hypothetical protein [Immundisolibacter sp.]